MSFYNLPHPWNPGYVIPEYVMSEPPERGTFTTQWMPRGTIPSIVPDFLAKPGKKILGRNDAQLGSLGICSLKGDTLGADAIPELAPAVAAPAVAAPAGMTREQKIGLAVVGVGVAYLLFRKKR
jgi:hypothetical protein